MEYREFKVLVENRRKIEITKPNNLTATGDIRYDALTERLIILIATFPAISLSSDPVRAIQYWRGFHAS